MADRHVPTDESLVAHSTRLTVTLYTSLNTDSTARINGFLGSSSQFTGVNSSSSLGTVVIDRPSSSSSEPLLLSACRHCCRCRTVSCLGPSVSRSSLRPVKCHGPLRNRVALEAAQTTGLLGHKYFLRGVSKEPVKSVRRGNGIRATSLGPGEWGPARVAARSCRATNMQRHT